MSTISAVNPANAGAETRYYSRFTPADRVMHAVLVFTFLGLAATGLPLRFSQAGWSLAFARTVGGFSAILFFHKFCAVVLSIDFLAHIVDIGYKTLVKKQWWLLWGPNSMVPRLKDLQDFVGQLKWLVFLGPKPKFDRYTYWAKLDYWGVFWGMAIIGISGYAMWFSSFFAKFVPGSFLNIALLIHGEEALLAVGWIFVIHFFNEHLRPHNFPMEVSIFTGSQTEKEFREQHPEEFARAQDKGQLAGMRTTAPPSWATPLSRVFGGLAVVIGIVLIVLTAEAFIRY